MFVVAIICQGDACGYASEYRFPILSPHFLAVGVEAIAGLLMLKLVLSANIKLGFVSLWDRLQGKCTLQTTILIDIIFVQNNASTHPSAFGKVLQQDIHLGYLV